MAGWQEFYLGWELSIEEVVAGIPNRIYGSGKRVYKLISSGTDTLPSIDDAFYDPTTSTTYPDIICTKKTFTHEFIEQGESNCTTGRICTCTYETPKDVRASATGGSEDEVESTWNGDTRILLVPGEDYWTFYPNVNPGPIVWANDWDGHLIDQDIPIQIATGTFGRFFDFTDFDDFTDWLPTFASVAGKLNNAEYMGFPIGSVLCNSFSKNYVRNNRGRYVHRVEVQFNWMIVPGLDNDPWQCLPNPHNNGEWERVVRGTRSEGTGQFASIDSGLYEYVNFETLDPDYVP